MTKTNPFSALRRSLRGVSDDRRLARDLSLFATPAERRAVLSGLGDSRGNVTTHQRARNGA